MPENYDAWWLWQDVKTQLRVGGMGVVGLDYAEVRQAASELDIPWCRGIKRKMQAIEYELLKSQQSKDITQ